MSEDLLIDVTTSDGKYEDLWPAHTRCKAEKDATDAAIAKAEGRS